MHRVSFYRQGARRASDGVAFETREAAEVYGAAEVARVAAMPAIHRDPTIDWATRYSVRSF